MHKDNYFQRFKNDKEYQRHYKEASEMLEIAIQVAGARKKKKITQVELANRIGMPQSQIARLESGNHNVTLETLNKVASALDLKVTVA
ncbi:MAG: helix-turn-helix transcriptional regulator [Patescibacteria group bacterium]|jgi:predicted transcriptional regulator